MPDLYLSWQTDPVLLGSLVTLAVVYGLVAGPLRSRIAPAAPFPVRSAIVWYGTIVLLYLLEGSPLHDLAERYSLTAHMVQHLGVAYVAAPLLLASVPAWMSRPLWHNRWTAGAMRLATNPLVTFGAFTLFFSAWHVPRIYEGALQNASLHHFEHFIFLLTSLMMWWPLMSNVPERPKLNHLLRLVYLFLLPVFQIPVFGAVTFSGEVLYPTYANSPWTLGIDPLSEQALAGAVMKIAGLFGFGIPFAVIWFRWYAEESRPQRPRSARPVRDAGQPEGVAP